MSATRSRGLPVLPLLAEILRNHRTCRPTSSSLLGSEDLSRGMYGAFDGLPAFCGCSTGKKFQRPSSFLLAPLGRPISSRILTPGDRRRSTCIQSPGHRGKSREHVRARPQTLAPLSTLPFRRPADADRSTRRCRSPRPHNSEITTCRRIWPAWRHLSSGSGATAGSRS